MSLLLEPVERELAGIGAFGTISLAEVAAAVPLLRRTDRKYLIGVDVLGQVLGDLDDSFAVLEIAGRTSTGYRTLYFDSPGFAACHAHSQKRRRRWKVRRRTYLEDGFSRIELKVKDNRGSTVKFVGETSADLAGPLDDAEIRFVRGHLDETGYGHSVPLAALRPATQIDYRRTTLASCSTGVRLTIDTSLSARLGDRSAALRPDMVVLETKGSPQASGPDRLLLDLGIREASFSKYVATTSSMWPPLSDNDVRRLQRRGVLRSDHSPRGDGRHRR